MRRKEIPRCNPVERGEGETDDMGVAETVGAAGAEAVNIVTPQGVIRKRETLLNRLRLKYVPNDENDNV